MLKVKNNYNETLTNLACSIKKYFDLEYTHNTISYIDDLLNKKKPENVVVILLDGLGANILERNLSKDDFLVKNKYKNITTVFPATTTAATTSMITGLDPIEHGYLGWYSYIKSLDKVVVTFFGTDKETDTKINEYDEINQKVMINKSIVEELNEKGNNLSTNLNSFKDCKYKNLDDMLNIIKDKCQTPGKKYIYAYNDEPDHTMHNYGPDSMEAKILIKERNDKIEALCENLENTIVFIVADHGHIKVDNFVLDDYQELKMLIKRPISIEPRAASFEIKEGYEKDFEQLFNKYFGKYFSLYPKKEIIESHIFGYGNENPIFKDAIGDYIAIAENSNKAFIDHKKEALVSQHAGYTDDEIYIPLIIVDKTGK